jgi:NADPH-dependent F420 reductase
VNPLAFDKRGAYGVAVDAGLGSAAETAQRLHPEASVVGAFHHVSAVRLWSDAEYLNAEDVLVIGDSAEAKEQVIQLAASVTGRPGIDAGKLRLARHLEPLTAMLISVNRKYKTHSGIRLSGVY